MSIEENFFSHECVPPFAEWAVRSNTFAALSRQPLAEAFRRELWREAETYTQSIADVAVIEEVEAAPLVATGHQPIIYHWGLAYKNILLERLAEQQLIRGLNIIIDTDEGDAGAIAFPARHDTAQLHVGTATLSNGAGLFLRQQLQGAATRPQKIRDILAEVSSAYLSENFQTALARYAALPDQSVVDANTALRRDLLGLRRQREIRLSAICRFPSFRKILGFLLRDPAAFFEAFNRSIEEFRDEAKIKNAANPFPNLKMSAEGIELPLWVINTADGVRHIPVARRQEEQWQIFSEGRAIGVIGGEVLAYAPNHLIAPRGMMTTLIMRMFGVDLFVHGIGGYKYDRFTDVFAKAYYATDLAPAAMATATRYLDEERVRRHQQAEKFNVKDLVHRPLEFADLGLFETEGGRELRDLHLRRSHLLDELKTLQARNEPTGVLTREKKELENRMRDLAEQSPVAQKIRTFLLSGSEQSVYMNREFPFFLFM